MASPVGDSYSGRKNVGITGGKLRRKNVTMARCTQANSVSAAVVSASAGSHSVTVANVGQANYASPVYLLGPSVPAGEWQQLTVASHSRKVIATAGNGAVGTFTPTKALAIEAQSPVTVSAIPARAFSFPVIGERGIVYLTGGLHSNYQGNEIDRMELPVGANTVITTTISHQPNMPPEGIGSGYASGNGGYIYRQYDGGLADNSNWQPYPGHQWTKNGWNPYWGFFSITAFALQDSYPNGAYQTASGLVLSSSTQPTDDYADAEDVQGVVAFDWATGKYKTHINPANFAWPNNTIGQSGVSDWNNYNQDILLFNTVAGTTNIQKWNPISGITVLGYTNVIGGYDGHGGNGILIRHLEANKYLILRQDGAGTFAQRVRLFIYSEDFGVGDARFVALVPPSPVNAIPDNIDGLTFCVDHTGRRVIWMVFPGLGVPCRFFVSTYEDLMAWTELSITPSIVIPNLPYRDAWLAGNRQPILYKDGYLYLMDGSGSGPNDPGYTDGAVNWKRAKIDGGEELPAMSFQRFDHRLQDSPYFPGSGFFTFSHISYLQVWGTKHANWAKRATDGAYYNCAGDMGASFTQSMAKLVFDGTARGFTFSELLSETQAMTGGKKRPISPDDGAWWYCGASNTNPALADKFIWARGGDGAGFSSNIFTRATYLAYAENQSAWNSGSDTGSPGAVAKMQEDGWTNDKILIYDPVTNGFSETNTAAWTFDSGGTTATHPSLMPSAACRNGAFDTGTNTLFRFFTYNGSLMLAAYKFDTSVVKLWNISSWYDATGMKGPVGRRWYIDGQFPVAGQTVVGDFGFYAPDTDRWHAGGPGAWEHKAVWVNAIDGKLYCVSPQTGFLWCVETRGVETDFGNAGDGKTLPFYPVGNRIPLYGTYPPTGSLDIYPPAAYGTKTQGQKGYTNGDTAMNSFLVPFKGGLLWWSMGHHQGGVSGHPAYAYWRRLDYTGDWSKVTFQVELAANSYGLSSSDINNSELLLISCAGGSDGVQGPWPFFWKLT